MLAPLAKHYRVFAIDLLGMGLSSRPEFHLTKTQETIDFFVDTLELWRKKLSL